MLNLPYPISQNRYWRVRVINGVAMTYVSAEAKAYKQEAAGLKSLRELSEIASVSTRTLENWHKHNPQRFAVILAGAVAVKRSAK